MLAMRHYMRGEQFEGAADPQILAAAGLDPDTVHDMYRIMALAAYEERYVIPTGHREETLDAYGESGSCGFSFGNGCAAHSNSETDLFESPRSWRGRSGSKPDNRINTLFTQTFGDQSSCGCGKGGCGKTDPGQSETGQSETGKRETGKSDIGKREAGKGDKT
jgi:nitrate reductase beta subunit